ncbi:MAG: ribosome-associated translation inhibitor RaiA [Acidobacteriota bacterium]|nr:ribosome-associated translation inhibitor RaiA [Acidobacteriota bacterium]
MRIEVTGRHLEVTPAIKTHVETELKKLSNMFPGDAANAHFVVDVEKNRQRAEIVLMIGERALTATTTDKDLYTAVTKAVQKVEKQALKLKEKRVDRRQNAKKTAAVAPTPDGNIMAAPPPPQIVEANNYAVKPMTPEEAAILLAGDTSQFLVFRDAESESLSVIYKRSDGNYGLIQP